MVEGIHEQQEPRVYPAALGFPEVSMLATAGEADTPEIPLGVFLSHPSPVDQHQDALRKWTHQSWEGQPLDRP
ncbi:Phosphorylase B Kinase Regulatory Subunit Beta [Manis pentadactyla]|nr:Phosphorylase B Kinase Regulatory Subunit Beta [Manis pentadactyla]